MRCLLQEARGLVLTVLRIRFDTSSSRSSKLTYRRLMLSYAVPVAAPASLAIDQSDQRFPVRRIFCIGRNYIWPEQAGQPMEAPFFFMKPADALRPAEGVIPYPPQTTEFCHEIELVVAIGLGGFNIAVEQAHEHIWGYGVGIDLTRRDQQQQAKVLGRPWEGSKAFDASATCTPLRQRCLAGDLKDAEITLRVNGQVRQRASVQGLIHPVESLISALSSSVRLQPGDLIYTGTPAGVSTLQVGDVLEGRIEGVGHFSLEIGPSEMV